MEKKSEALREPEVEGGVQVQGEEAKLVELGDVSRETRGGPWGNAIESAFTLYFG